MKWKGFASTSWELVGNLLCPVLLKEIEIKKLMSHIKLCLVAPSSIGDSGLCFEALTDWVVSSTRIRVKPVPHRSPIPHVKGSERGLLDRRVFHD